MLSLIPLFTSDDLKFKS